MRGRRERRAAPTPAWSTTSPGIARICDERGALDARRRRVRRRRAPRAVGARRCSPASSAPTRSSSTRTSGCTRRSTARRCSTAIPSLARSVHGQHAAYLDSVNDETDGLEPRRLRVPAHAARPRPAVLVLARGARLRRVPGRGRAGARRSRAPRRPASARSPTSSSCANPSSRSCCSAASGWDSGAVHARGRERAVARPGRARRADTLARRDGGPARVPAPGHHARDRRRDPRDHALNGIERHVNRVGRRSGRRREQA